MARRSIATLALAALISLACSTAPASTPITITLLTAPQPSQACEDALAQGTLVPDPRSGLGLVSANNERTTVMWPFGYSARLDAENQIVLVDPDGRDVAMEGDVVQMGGGFGAGNMFYACAGSITPVGG